MHGIGISRGVNGHGGNAEFLARAKNTQCNLAAIGNEDLVKHDRFTRCSSEFDRIRPAACHQQKWLSRFPHAGQRCR